MGRSLLLSILTVLLSVLAAACSDLDPGGASGASSPAARGSGTSSSPPPPSSSAAPGEVDTSPVAVVAIDVQSVFFTTAQARNPAGVADRMARIAHVFELAGAHQAPVFITFEASETGDHALPPALATALPKTAQHFVKTTFAATGQARFLPAIAASGAHRLLVVGAETDVCVLQTMLGLRRAGYDVLALVDALFTEEVNDRPALRRMREAGITTVDMQAAEAILTSAAGTPAPPATPPPASVRPLELGLVLHDLEGLGDADVNASAKTVRLRELLLVSEWFKLPVFAADPAKAKAALPASLAAVLERPIADLASRPSTVTQLAVAGAHDGVAQAVAALAKDADVFVLEDALLGSTASELEPLYLAASGARALAVPSTYKTLYYELIQSVDDAGWPSQQWVIDGQSYYYNATKAPEELPPLVVP
jgi:nicotinamidase-related amidase